MSLYPCDLESHWIDNANNVIYDNAYFCMYAWGFEPCYNRLASGEAGYWVAEVSYRSWHTYLGDRFPQKIPEHQGSAELPWLASLCTCHTFWEKLSTDSDSTGRRQLEAHAWVLLDSALCTCFLGDFNLGILAIINCKHEYNSSPGSCKSFHKSWKPQHGLADLQHTWETGFNVGFP